MHEPRITIVPAGPMVVDGLLLGRLHHVGDMWRVEPIATPSAVYAICRCGRSSQMPLCDRSAPYGCFDEQPPTGPEPAPYRWDVPKPDGPVRVAGNAAITYGDRELSPRDRVSLCRCGESRCQPLCDSSHKVVG